MYFFLFINEIVIQNKWIEILSTKNFTLGSLG